MFSKPRQTIDPHANPSDLVDRGRALFYKGQKYQAQMTFAEAVLRAPDNTGYKSILIQSLAGQSLNQHNNTLKQAITACLEDDNIRHLPLFFSWYSLLLSSSTTGKISKLQKCTIYEAFLQALEAHDYSKILNNSFLCKGLKKLLMKDYDFERLLTRLRRYALLRADDNRRQNIAPFLIALSGQCFFNEYVFFVTEEEQEKLNELEAAPDIADPFNIILLSCYRPLYQLQNAEKLAASLGNSEIDGVEDIIRIQITEPLEEMRIMGSIKNFGNIRNKTSKAVQDQYEEHPFPRWVSCGSERESSKQELSAGKKILIAGCGTGQQAVTASMNFPGADITAIDLSKASLAYAQRKTKEYGLGNLTFLHGDILDVKNIGEAFDYIACGGVLHHMNVPKDGFLALKSVLKPDGVMRIGVYSELARRNIVAVQNWITDQKIPSSAEGIRNFRKKFIEGGYRDVLGDTLPYFDIFTISETRDLFFHVQEHRFTCPVLKDLLEDAALDLLVFAPESHAARQRYTQLFPDDPSITNLENWHQIEEVNPGLFIGMYKFYVAHKGQYPPGGIPAWLSL